MANRATGKGYENESFYTNIKFQFWGIENIHVMRASLQKLIEGLFVFLSSRCSSFCHLHDHILVLLIFVIFSSSSYSYNIVHFLYFELVSSCSYPFDVDVLVLCVIFKILPCQLFVYTVYELQKG